MVTPLVVRRRTQETITLAAMRATAKVSRTRSMRKVPKSSRLKRATRSLQGILGRLLRNLQKCILSLELMSITPIYRRSS